MSLGDWPVLILDYRVLIPEEAGLQVIRVVDLLVVILDYRVLIWKTARDKGAATLQLFIVGQLVRLH